MVDSRCFSHLMTFNMPWVFQVGRDYNSISVDVDRGWKDLLQPLFHKIKIEELFHEWAYTLLWGCMFKFVTFWILSHVMCALMIGRRKTQMRIELNFIDGNGLNFHTWWQLFCIIKHSDFFVNEITKFGFIPIPFRNFRMLLPCGLWLSKCFIGCVWMSKCLSLNV